MQETFHVIIYTKPLANSKENRLLGLMMNLPSVSEWNGFLGCEAPKYENGQDDPYYFIQRLSWTNLIFVVFVKHIMIVIKTSSRSCLSRAQDAINYNFGKEHNRNLSPKTIIRIALFWLSLLLYLYYVLSQWLPLSFENKKNWANKVRSKQQLMKTLCMEFMMMDLATMSLLMKIPTMLLK